MKLLYAAEYRSAARATLRGKWPEAVLVGLVAGLLCGEFGQSGMRFNANLNMDQLSDTVTSFSFDGSLVEFLQQLISSGFAAGILAVSLLIGLIGLVVSIVLGGVIETGYARYNMKLVSGAAASFSDLFYEFRRWGTCLVMRLLRAVLIFVGFLLFFVPGVMLTYGFRMAPYILAEHPECGSWEALSESWKMMRGHKLRLFCLDFSFIGWSILCAFTCGIGYLLLNPYRNASEAIFYLELAGDYYASGRY